LALSFLLTSSRAQVTDGASLSRGAPSVFLVARRKSVFPSDYASDVPLFRFLPALAVARSHAHPALSSLGSAASSCACISDFVQDQEVVFKVTFSEGLAFSLARFDLYYRTARATELGYPSSALGFSLQPQSATRHGARL